MPEDRPRWKRILNVLLLAHLAGTVIASICLWLFGNPEAFGVKLTLDILWGVWFAHVLAQVLTRVAIFAWKFRRYFRPTGNEKPPPPPLRPTRAPWYKSGKVSFAFTIVLVSLTGACGIALVVMYCLKDVVGEWVWWLVSMIIFVSWWPLVILFVVIRVAIFGKEKEKAKQATGADNQAPSLAGQEVEDRS
jgi:hypothetical protein